MHERQLWRKPGVAVFFYGFLRCDYYIRAVLLNKVNHFHEKVNLFLRNHKKIVKNPVFSAKLVNLFRTNQANIATIHAKTNQNHPKQTQGEQT
jgi:hypothetical protein